ncbi:DnaT-like ssDNA-binding domain-containing protein [Alteromonadaceae bacterium BrNp21-10]|nr:DnaT-like ssDNA-binding domain-containing protein [Alteromonadaceae bacterium BrNp21-10]
MTLNQAELNALQQALSNEARVLYCLGLRPTVNTQSALSESLNYKALKALLNSKKDIISLGRQINTLIKELVDVGLVSYQGEQQEHLSHNGQQLLLPLLATSDNKFQQLHLQWSPMLANWQPNQQLFNELATLVGLIEKEYSDSDVGEFIAYWLTRPESNFTLFQWTQKFVQQIKKQRLAYGHKPLERIGNQLVSKKAGIEVDDNAKKLVEKYSAKHKQ